MLLKKFGLKINLIIQKNFLMLTNWPSGEINKDNSTKQVEKIINIISEIRSFKNELNVRPGSFIDMSIKNINKKKNLLLMIMK